MKIRCPQCQRISEIPHVDHGRIAVCACRATFRIDDSTVVEEVSLPDLPPPASIGRYKVVRYLGRGAMNCVYEGVHPDLGVPVAIKTLLPDYAADKPTRDMFLHAIKAYAKAVHPNIVKVYETGRDADGVPYLVMEFLSGGTLADAMQKNRFLTAKEAVNIGAEVCRALVVTAGLGIVHRDIKPDNIMLSADGQYKLTDLGLAKIDASAAGNDARILDENDPDKSARKTSFGTLEYMSPEQYIDTDSCDIRSDIYSLGVTMYQLATGRLPFETQTRSELRHMHISVEPLVPSSYMHGIPIDFDYIVMRCIQKRPEDRYATPEDLLADLEAFLADKPLPSTTCGAVPFVRTPALTGNTAEKQRSALLPVTAAVLCLLILAAAGLLILKERSEANREKLVPTQPVQEETVRDPSGFDVPSEESSLPRVRPSTKALGAEVTIEGDDADAKASGLFEDTKKAAAQAMQDGFGFKKAIDDLESFTSSEEYATETLNLISDLKKASDAAVAKLMDSLNEKAARLIEDGNFDGAINVYSTDIGPLAPESLPERERKMLNLELEKMRRAHPDMDTFGNAAPGSDETAAEEEPQP